MEQAGNYMESAEIEEDEETGHSSMVDKLGLAKRRVNYILLARPDSDAAYETVSVCL